MLPRMHHIVFLTTILTHLGMVHSNCQSATSYIQNCVAPTSECFHCLPCWNGGKAYLNPSKHSIEVCGTLKRPSACTTCEKTCEDYIHNPFACTNAQLVSSRLKHGADYTLDVGESRLANLSCPSNTSIHMLWAIYYKKNPPETGVTLGQECNANVVGQFARACNNEKTCVYNFTFDANCPSGYVFGYGYYCTPHVDGLFPSLTGSTTTVSNMPWYSQSNAIIFLVVAFLAGIPMWCFVCMCCSRSEYVKRKFDICWQYRTTSREDPQDDMEPYHRHGGMEPMHNQRDSESHLITNPGFENTIPLPFGYDSPPFQHVFAGPDRGQVKTNNSYPKDEESISVPVRNDGQLSPTSVYELPVGTSVAHTQQMPWMGSGIAGMDMEVFAPNATFPMQGERESAVSEVTTIVGVSLILHADLQFTQVIGQGSYGKVFRARWRGRTVAAKKFHRDNVDEQKVNDFIRHEIELSNKASNHENVLTVFGYCVDPFCLVTELMDSSVKKYLDYDRGDGRKCTIYKRAEIALQSAKGINHLHELNIVHRDIAARNILLTQEDSGSLKVVVSDFGMSRIMNQEAYAQTYSAVGPLKWMAPEAIKEQKFSKKSDTFAFGITLWEILTGLEPYPDIDAVNTAVEVLVRGRRPDIKSNIPHALSDLMQACWQSEPEDRPDFPAIMDALTGFISGN